MPTITADLHTHLIEKGEKPEKYWKAVRAKKLDAVAITEHADHQPEKAYRMLAEKKPRKVVLVPGVELNTSIGHVLAYAGDEGIYSIKKLLEKDFPIRKAMQIAEREGILLSVSHPWGLSYDSAAFIIGEKRLQRLVEGGGIGVESYNGMFGQFSGYFYSSSWVKKPMNFFDFLEKSRIGRKTRLGKLGGSAKRKLDKKGREVIERCVKPIELGEKAEFITAGSDSHSAERIGLGIMKVKARGRLDSEKLLQAIGEKRNIVWAGPFVRETGKGTYRIDKPKLHRKEVLQGLKYATKKVIVDKVSLGSK